ncbi:MAG: DNA polymerase/3'-5' exonuclease PolX [Thermoguttaceae bacterium]|jgi:DNA polymerase (family 10)|nr:DNA polymerase/3'-5' exonuclease PolX [Thermoguttaceae bacterium]
MTNAEIAAVFEQVADLLEFQGANPFRVRAYRNAARTVHDLAQSVAAIVESDGTKLTEIQGIGADLAEKISTLVRTGSLPMLDELLAQIPASVLAILRVPGLGPKRASTLYHELGISNLDQLRKACEAHRVRELKGFGAKTETAILQGLEIAAQAEQRVYWSEADQVAATLREHLAECDAIDQMEFAGSYRRGKDTVGDLDLLVVASDPAKVMDRFATYPALADVLARGDTKMSVRLQFGLQVDLRVVPAESFGAALQYFTGSKAHNVVLRGMAKDRGLKINEYGVFRGEKLIAGRTEEEVYAAVGLPWIAPELREARSEFDWAAAGQLPRLVELDDLRGDLHAHSTWSDGAATIEEMVEAARQRGLKYLAITDHSKRATIANGLSADRLLAQWAEIDRLSKRLRGFTLLKGVEVDILESGGLDLPDEVLAKADWVVASVHFGQNQSRERITERVIGALKNPHVWAIAHPTGRLLNKRKPYEIDLDAVLQAARDHGKLMELNAHPSRLDLDDVACAAAKKLGVPVVISTDAHTITGLDVLRYGVLQARRGGLTKDDVANARPWPQLKKLIGKAR